MKTAIYRITREIAIVLAMLSSFEIFSQGDIIRSIMNITLLGLFLKTSRMHQEKIKTPGVSYWYIFIILFSVNSLVSGACNETMIRSLNKEGVFGHWIGDYYSLYFIVSFIIYIIIIIQLHLMETIDLNTVRMNMLCDNSLKEPSDEKTSHLIGTILLLLIYFLFGRRFECLVPLFVYYSVKAIKMKEDRLQSIIFLAALSILFVSILQSRYKLIQMALPVLIAFIVLSESSSNVSMLKAYIIIIGAIAVLGLYGIVSEVLKLNREWGGNYSIIAILTNNALLKRWLYRQFYRVFAIWIKLGGYIIYHVKANGFFYGLTYVKSLAGLFDFEYVSLPKISAVYDSANYSQPGLLAEGYANFGIIGAVINLVLVYFLMIYLEKRFYENPSMNRLLYMIVPFSQILLDGGTLNSAIFLLIICFVFNFFGFMKTSEIVVRTDSYIKRK